MIQSYTKYKQFKSLADADTYLADLDKQIKHHTYEYKRLVNDGLLRN